MPCGFLGAEDKDVRDERLQSRFELRTNVLPAAGAATILPILLLFCVVPAPVSGQAPPVPPENPPVQEQERSSGLPRRVKWTFNFDAGWGTFGFANSLYDNPKEPGVDENLSDQWFEGYVKPALSGSYAFASTSELYGKVSVVGERTYGSVPTPFGSDVSSFGPEDLSIGWRSGSSIASLGENGLDFVVGRTQYQLGHGFLLWDGAAEGGSRGGYWTNARKAFAFAAIVRLTPGPHRVESFYLDKDELEEGETGSRLWGANYEYSIGETSTIGVTYMRWFADAAIEPARDGLNVLNLRAYAAPLKDNPDLSFEFEYAAERNAETLRSNAWTAQAAYELSQVAWTPKLAYRYAFFQGDDPGTAANEAFDPLFVGFYDWGYWWQGEIAGEYFLSNSNLASHLVSVQVTPNDSLGGGLLFFKFNLDRLPAMVPGLTNTDVALEIDAYVDWQVNANFTLSVVGAFADPGKAVQQATGRTRNFAYGMVYVGYSF
jgi:hypothetical protein